MLLLLRSPPSALPVGNAGISFGVVGLAGPQGSAGISFGNPAPTSIELQVSAKAGITLGAAGIPVGFLSGSGIASLNLGLIGAGGFGSIANADIRLGTTGTIGSTLQGVGNASLTIGGAADPRITTTAGVSLFLNISGSATVSGGTLTPTAVASINLSVNGVAVASASAVADIMFSAAGTGFPMQVGFATDMRVSFESDEIRLFFRKG